MVKYIPPQKPRKIKVTEKNRINPAYTILSVGNKFIPIPGVSYLWVLNKRKQLIVGIERPWEYPQAFNFDLNDPEQQKQWEQIYAQLQTLPEGIDSHLGFGHPTLGVGFFDQGKVDEDSPYLGGELNLREGNWIVDNKSGRHGHFEEREETNQLLIANTLVDVVEKFANCGLEVSPQLYFETPKISHPFIPIFSKKTGGNLVEQDNAGEEILPDEKPSTL